MDPSLIFAVRVLAGAQSDASNTVPSVPVDTLANFPTYLSDIKANLGLLYVDEKLENLGGDLRNGIMVGATPFCAPSA